MRIVAKRLSIRLTLSMVALVAVVLGALQLGSRSEEFRKRANSVAEWRSFQHAAITAAKELEDPQQEAIERRLSDKLDALYSIYDSAARRPWSFVDISDQVGIAIDSNVMSQRTQALRSLHVYSDVKKSTQKAIDQEELAACTSTDSRKANEHRIAAAERREAMSLYDRRIALEWQRVIKLRPKFR